MKFTPFPKIITEKLLLRQAKSTDCSEILFLRSDAEVGKYIKRVKPKTIADAIIFLDKITKGIEDGKNIYWCITLKNNPKMIGSICLWNFSADLTKAEVGYDLHPAYQNKGIMSEAMKVVLNFGFEKLKFHQIEAYTHFQNEASKSLLLKNNFTLVEGKKDEGNANNIIFKVGKNSMNNSFINL